MAKKIKIKSNKTKKPEAYGYYNNLGLDYKHKGQADEAIKCFKKAIELMPDYAEAYSNLGNVLADSGMLDEAIDSYKKSLLLKSDADVYYNLALAFTEKSMTDEAIWNYKITLSLSPDFTDAYYNLGNAFKEKGLVDEAIENYKKALILKPDYAEAYNNLGSAFADKDMFEEAIKNYKIAIKLKSDYPEAFCNLGSALRYHGLIDDAIANFNKSLLLKPDYAMAYNNLDNALIEKGIIDEAIENYTKALFLKSDFHEAHNNLGLAYLLARDFDRGWAEYEWRPKGSKVFTLSKPVWDGNSLENKIILVFSEQGYGDMIQFVNYLPLLHDHFRAKKVLFRPQKGLEQLLKDSELKAEILDAETPVETLEYDTNIHLLSLPRIFKTNLENIPFSGKRYLKANPEKVRWYRERYFIDRERGSAEARKSGDEADGKHRSGNDLSLATCHLPLKVGISWQGSLLFKSAAKKALPLSYFYPLTILPDVRVYSLQKGYGIEQMNDLPEGVEITDLGETFNDFSDTAAAIENLDIVITIDTAVAHLSGALGKKTWILLPPYADWRWFSDTDYSPWYEDVRLFRHKELGKKDWEEVIRQVKVKVEEITRLGNSFLYLYLFLNLYLF